MITKKILYFTFAQAPINYSLKKCLNIDENKSYVI